MGRRRFTHLHTELSVAVGARVPRYALWLALEEHGGSAQGLTREAVLSFRHGPLARFLAEHGLTLDPRAGRRLTRALERFDPGRATPEEVLARWGRAFERSA